MSVASPSAVPEQLLETEAGRRGLLRGLVLPMAAVGLLATLAAPFLIDPAEDAAILFQYSRNLAHTGTISYLPGTGPVEGATDFLWMLLLTVPAWLGIDPFVLTGILNAASLLGTAYLLLRFADAPITTRRIAAIVLALTAAPAFSAAVMGFSVYAFCAVLALTAWLYVAGSDLALFAACLTLCLLRPDGVVFAAPLCACRLLFSRHKLRTLAVCTAVLVLPGLAYFVWRYRYFGELFPLPFLVKANAPRVLGLFVASTVADGAMTILSVLPVLFVACRQRLSRDNLVLLVSLVGLPTLFYLCMRLDQNVADRFFHYVLVGAAIIVAHNLPQLRNQRTLVLVSLACYALCLALPCARFRWALLRDVDNSPSAVARAIAKSGVPGTMAVTEAGRLIYYSDWTGIDLWGLNTPEYAKHFVQPDDIRQLGADLVVVHFPPTFDCGQAAVSGAPYSERSWDNMVANILAGLDGRSYELLMLPYESRRLRGLIRKPAHGRYDCLYVRRDAPAAPELERILRDYDALPYPEYKALLSSN